MRTLYLKGSAPILDITCGIRRSVRIPRIGLVDSYRVNNFSEYAGSLRCISLYIVNLIKYFLRESVRSHPS